MSKFTNLLAQARQRQDEADLPDESEHQDVTGDGEDAAAVNVAPRSESALSPTRSAQPQIPSSDLKAEKVSSRRQVPSEKTTLSTTGSKASRQANVASLSEDAPRRGRPQGPAGGKRSNPDYEQITAYIPRKLHQNSKIALMRSNAESDQKQDFSTLVEDLLTSWLATKGNTANL